MVFALLRCRKRQIMVCKAWFWPCLINLGSEKLFLYLPRLFSLASEEVGTPCTQVSSLGMAPRCPKPSMGLSPYPHPHEQELKFPAPPSRDQQTQCSEERMAWEWAVGGGAKFPSHLLQGGCFIPGLGVWKGDRACGFLMLWGGEQDCIPLG